MATYDAVVGSDRFTIINKSTGQNVFSLSQDGFGPNLPFNVVDSLNASNTSHSYLPSTLCLQNALLSVAPVASVVDIPLVLTNGASTPLTLPSLWKGENCCGYYGMPGNAHIPYYTVVAVFNVSSYTLPSTTGTVHLIWKSTDLTAGVYTVGVFSHPVILGQPSVAFPSIPYPQSQLSTNLMTINKDTVGNGSGLSLYQDSQFPGIVNISGASNVTIYIQRGMQITDNAGVNVIAGDTCTDLFQLWSAFVRFTAPV